jgi:hypothetical protein
MIGTTPDILMLRALRVEPIVERLNHGTENDTKRA